MRYLHLREGCNCEAKIVDEVTINIISNVQLLNNQVAVMRYEVVIMTK